MAGIRCGSAAFWLTVVINFPVLGSLTYLAAKKLLRRQALALAEAQAQWHSTDEPPAPIPPGQVEWDDGMARRWTSVIAVTSVAAGCLGLGGGQIIKPIFNELDFPQDVSSATAALMMLFMSSTTVTQFVLFGALRS